MPESEESSDADAAEARLIGAFGAIQPPVEVLLGSGKMHLRVGGAMIGLLVDNQPLCSRMTSGT